MGGDRLSLVIWARVGWLPAERPSPRKAGSEGVELWICVPALLEGDNDRTGAHRCTWGEGAGILTYFQAPMLHFLQILGVPTAVGSSYFLGVDGSWPQHQSPLWQILTKLWEFSWRLKQIEMLKKIMFPR